MHIAINTLPLSGGHSRRGIGLYTKELINALTEFEPSHSYSFFTKSSEIDSRADIIHYPFFDPFFLTLPWISPKRTVITVHDLIPIVFADHFPRGVRGELTWRMQRWALKRIARSVLTDSNASKADIERVTGFPKDRVFVTTLAPRPAFRPITNKKRLSEVRKRYELNTKFILYVGDVNWNKNVLGLVEAFTKLEQTYKKTLLLALVGKAFLDETLPEAKSIHQRIEQLSLTQQVRFLGFVSDSDLTVLYSQAEALICPSFAEGFGLPVLEAQACGCPVVASDVSSVAEIAGPAIRVDPFDRASIMKGIDHVLSLTATAKAAMKKEGESWAAGFTWENVAHQTVRVYEKTLGRI